MSGGTLKPFRRGKMQNPFLDIEAGQSGDSDGDPYMGIESGDEASDTGAEDDSGIRYAAIEQQSRTRDEGDQEEWIEAFLDRARRRSVRSALVTLSDPILGGALPEDARLWEIGCKLGREDAAVMAVLSRATNRNEQQILANSAISIIPGRIYVEVATKHDALNVAKSVPSLNSSMVREVKRSELPMLLGYKQQRLRPQSWRRYLGPWKEYHGDTALIVNRTEGNSELELLLVPRLPSSGCPLYQAAPVLRTLSQLQVDNPENVQEFPDGSFAYNKRKYLASGLLVVSVKDAALSEEMLPSIDNVDIFYRSGSLENKVYISTTRMIEQHRLKHGDRVKVVLGDFSGLYGHVISVESGVALVNLPSQGSSMDIPVSCLRAHFVMGDEVQLCPAAWKEATGWVLSVDRDSVTVYVRALDTLVQMKSADVEFYSAPFHTTLRMGFTQKDEDLEAGDGIVMRSLGFEGRGGTVLSVSEDRVRVRSLLDDRIFEVDKHDVRVIDKYRQSGKRTRLSLSDRYAAYKGKMVTVVGTHIFKGWQGTIEDTLYNGTAWVRLNNSQQQRIQVQIDDLYLGWAQLDWQAQAPSPQPKTSDDHARNEDVPAATPVIASSTSLESVLPPFPISRTSPSWLNEFRGPRFQVVEAHDPRAVCEVVSAGADHAEIKGHFTSNGQFTSRKRVSLNNLRAVLPSSVGDLVLRITGEDRGQCWRVRKYGDEECTIYKYGEPTEKKRDTKTWPTQDLVRVYPPDTGKRRFQVV